MTGNLRERGVGCAGSLLRGLDEAGHGEGAVGVGEAGTDTGPQLALDAPLLARGGLDRDPSLVAVAVDVEDAGQRGGGEHGLAPLRSSVSSPATFSTTWVTSSSSASASMSRTTTA